MTNRFAILRRVVGFARFSFASLLLCAGIAKTACAAAPSVDAAKNSAEAPSLRWVELRQEDWDRRASKPVTSSEIDDLLRKELEACGYPAVTVPRTTDEQFIRRVSLDLTGRLPNSTDIAEFTAS